MNAAIAAPNFVRPLSSPTATSGAAASGSNPRRVALLWGGRAPPSLRSPSSRTRAAARSDGTLYDLLGVPASGSSGDVKKAYRELALKYHPDVSPPDLAAEYTQRFIEVHEAYEILSDPDRRALYDNHLRSGVAVLFSGRRLDEKVDDLSGWRSQWLDQLAKLKQRSKNDSDGNLSWGARMRKRWAESS
ncbi:chaperone protein dnaJ 20, chloroplastic-like [Curcuma longa]|uniref:chaperone protein dnaJ 20, chloroplastic-like n=1 Tax=Curcuma longa TaxID=136217 RepID=UPI003D9E384C